MNESKQKFVDRLLAADPPSLAGRGQYELQVCAMFEKKLSRQERWMYGSPRSPVGFIGHRS